MSDNDTSVTIRILDRDYRISCAKDERDDLKKAAAHLDEKMQEVKEAQVVGLDRIAVMAALNIAHDLMQANKSLSSKQDDSKRLGKLTERMDKEIQAFNDYRNELL